MTDDGAERVRAAVRLLANTSMNLSLADWSAISTDILRLADRYENLVDATNSSKAAETERATAEGTEIKRLRDCLKAASAEITRYAREAGEAMGRLEGSEVAGAVDAWREECERLRVVLAKAAEGERAVIVAWLRRRTSTVKEGLMRSSWSYAADLIERGDHLK